MREITTGYQSWEQSKKVRVQHSILVVEERNRKFLEIFIVYSENGDKVNVLVLSLLYIYIQTNAIFNKGRNNVFELNI